MLDFNKALAFIKLCGKSGPKLFLEGRLGADRVPTADDFLSDDPEKTEKAEEFIDYLEQVYGSLTEGMRNRPRQTTLVPSADGSILEVKGVTSAQTVNTGGLVAKTSPPVSKKPPAASKKKPPARGSKKRPPAGKKKPPAPKKSPTKKR